jgi:dienelactone hydrolase
MMTRPTTTCAALAGLVLAAAFSASTSAQVQKSTVEITASDGVVLKGTYLSPGRLGPAMLLLHQCNMDRHAWDSLAADLAAAGLHVLAIDYRGYGESGGERLTDMAQRRPIMQQKWPGDVDAAYAYLVGRKDVDKGRVAAGGASCGVTRSSDLAARHHEIKALMLLSGTASDQARAYITATPELPIFGAASEGDAGAAKGITEAVEASKNPRSTLKIYQGTEHGVPMFAKNPELEPAIVSWLKTQLATAGRTY